MSLLELFDKWVIERGSAKVQEKHIALFRDQLSQAEAKNYVIESENKSLKSQLVEAEIENENLKKKMNEIEKAVHSGNLLSLQFGVYWDNDGNVYCPKCKAPGMQIKWATYVNQQVNALKCSCADTLYVLMENGVPIHAQEAMKRMAR